MKEGGKWYVVWRGRETGVFSSWSECKASIEAYPKALYKSFPSRSAALRAYEDGYESYRKKNYESASDQYTQHRAISEALAVDAACSGNPGVLEFRGVLLSSHIQLFHRGPYPKGTNNIGEFLAIVLGLAYIQSNKLPIPAIYSDSMTAISWVKNKRCKTLLVRDEQTEPLLEAVAKAEQWLREHEYSTVVLKWRTDEWGEIPADFGRKR